MLVQPVLDASLFATVLTVTYHKIQWSSPARSRSPTSSRPSSSCSSSGTGSSASDVRLTRTAAVALAFLVAFAIVYLAGFYSLDTGQALAQWAKGMVKFVLHFGFLATGVALLARRSRTYYWYALAAFCVGIALNAVYGVVQLLLAETTGTNSTRSSCSRSPRGRRRSTCSAPSRAPRCSGRTR